MRRLLSQMGIGAFVGMLLLALFFLAALIGPWIAELGTTWRNASQELDRRKLVVDLTNVTVNSPEGEVAIFDLMKKGANFSCSGILMRHLLKELARKKPEECPRS